MVENRRFPRIQVSFPIECRSLLSRSYFYTVSKDLSLVGVKIITNEFLAKNDLLKININLINKMVNLKAKVAWCNKERASERYSTGLEFVEISPINREEISVFLDKVHNH